MKLDITAETLKSKVSYDRNTGKFTWLKGLRAGLIAGTDRASGYRQICINKNLYLAHRLAWLYEFGAWPKHQIDHINGKRADNRICNLRDVSHEINCQNNHVSKGVRYWPKSGRHQALIGHRGCQINLGSYATQDLAREAYVQAKRLLHKGCTI